MKKRKIIINIAMIVLIVYFIITFISQQKKLNSYKTEQEYVASKIEEQEKLNKTLISKKDKINSTEYIEEIAREKLDMYKPNESVYIDVGK